MGVGIYYKAEKYFGGVSLNHILKTQFDFNSDSLKNALTNNLVINGGYVYELNYDIILTPPYWLKQILYHILSILALSVPIERSFGEVCRIGNLKQSLP
jgi:hypothetical protein